LTRKIRTHISALTHKNTQVLSAPKLPHNWRQCIEIVTGASRNIYKHVFAMNKLHDSFKLCSIIIPGTS